MEVQDAIRRADVLLPGEPVEEGVDPRWQAIVSVAEFIPTDPEPVWSFIRRWGGHPQKDLRSAIGTCLLEHLLEGHFAEYFPRVEELALANPLFADTLQGCWQFGQAEEPANAARWRLLLDRLEERQRA